MTQPITHFALLAQPTLIFRVVKAYDAAGFIPSLVGVTLDGKRQTAARVADVCAVPMPDLSPAAAPLYRYRLRSTKHSSERYGACEVCQTHCSEVFTQIEMRAYAQAQDESGGIAWTYHQCRTTFGHRDCLTGLQHARTVETEAEQMGREAFAAGIPAASARDPAVMLLLAGLKPGEALPVLDAWSRGWHAANLAAPVPGWTAEENAALVAARTA